MRDPIFKKNSLKKQPRFYTYTRKKVCGLCGVRGLCDYHSRVEIWGVKKIIQFSRIKELVLAQTSGV